MRVLASAWSGDAGCGCMDGGGNYTSSPIIRLTVTLNRLPESGSGNRGGRKRETRKNEGLKDDGQFKRWMA